jgi:hypothetical protein
MNAKVIKKILLAGLALAGLMAGQAVHAQATSATVAVSAVVPKACRFYSSPAPMVIEHGGGLIDPTSAVNATGSSTLNYRCMSGVSPQFDIDSSGTFASPKTVTVVLTDGTNNMNADITMTATGGAGSGLGAGQNKVGTISGLIAPADFQAAVPSTYSKTVTIDIQAIP